LKEEKKVAAAADKKKGLVPDVQKSAPSVISNANPIAVSVLPFDEKGKDTAPVSPLQKIEDTKVNKENWKPYELLDGLV